MVRRLDCQLKYNFFSANISTNLTRTDYLSRGNKLQLFSSEIEFKSQNDPGNLQLTPTNLIADLHQSNVCCDCCPSVSVQRACNDFALNRKHIFYVYSDVADDTSSLKNNLDNSSNSLASMSSIDSMSIDKKYPMPLSKSSSDFRETFNSEKLLEQSGNDSSILASILNVDSGMISLSKSETNIFEGSNSIKLAVYDVVSLNDLNDVGPFPHKPMIDLSKNQLLHNLSNEEMNFKK